jgi:hypothetical protein
MALARNAGTHISILAEFIAIDSLSKGYHIIYTSLKNVVFYKPFFRSGENSIMFSRPTVIYGSARLSDPRGDS